MALELSENDLAGIVAEAADRLRAAVALYENLLHAVRARAPTLSDARIDATRAAILAGTWRDDGDRVTQTAFGCALYQAAALRCAECIELLANGRGTGEILRNMFAAQAGMFGALGALAAFLNGEPLVRDRALDDMQRAAEEIRRAGGKVTQRAVADRSGHDRSAVRRRWSRLR